jgi:dTDP-4-dehydrorhamnose 3,5-epimerase
MSSTPRLRHPKGQCKRIKNAVQVTPLDIPGAVLIALDVYRDARGLFLESYHQGRYEKAGIPGPFVQDNYSESVRGTLRGLHYQEPQAQGKLVMVLDGAVYDVIVDIRKGSPAFGRWQAIELSADNRRQLYVPPGCAHGFCVTSERAAFLYKCTDFYDAQAERGLPWNDPAFNILWPIASPILSAKDQAYRPLAAGNGDLPLYRPH